MQNTRAPLFSLALSAIWLMTPSAAPASDAICANPQGPIEVALCEDPHLMGINLQIQNVLVRFLDDPNDPLPEWLSMEYGHHMIAAEECEGAYRCLESVMVDFLDHLNQSYLEYNDTPLAGYEDVKFTLHQSQDSSGNDLMPWNDPRNFGWSQKLCQLRCANSEDCVAVGFDPLQQVNNVFGYCTMKSAVNYPLSGWTPEGVLLIKQ